MKCSHLLAKEGTQLGTPRRKYCSQACFGEAWQTAAAAGACRLLPAISLRLNGYRGLKQVAPVSELITSLCRHAGAFPLLKLGSKDQWFSTVVELASVLSYHCEDPREGAPGTVPQGPSEGNIAQHARQA